MNKQFTNLMGLTLILAGLLALGFNLFVSVIDMWRLWPIFVIGMGLILVLSPLLIRGQRGLGVLFIPGVPILTTGGILLFASLFEAWGSWALLWPLEVLAVAMGFLLAATYTRIVWLVVPAIIIGANGLLFQFCAITNEWDVWAALWTIEPLSVGLAMLALGVVQRSPGLVMAGLVICGFSGMALAGMTVIFTGWWLINLAGPATLILAGTAMLAWGAISRLPSTRPAAE